MFILRVLSILLVLAFPLAAQNAPSGPAELVAASRLAKENGDNAAAVEHLEKALRFFDENQPAHHANIAFLLNELSVLYRALNRQDDAFVRSVRAIELVRSDPAQTPALSVYLINRALAAIDLQRFNSAAADLRLSAQIASQAPVQTLALRTLAAAELSLGNPNSTIDIIEQLRARDVPDDTATLALLTRAYLTQREVALARESIDAALGTAMRFVTPETLDLRILDARVAIQEARFDAAQQTLEEALEAAERFGESAAGGAASALYNLAEVEFMRGRFTEADVLNQRAERAFALAYGEDHFSVGQTGHRRAVISQELGDLERAVELYSASGDLMRGILGEVHPLVVSSYTERAQALARMGEHDEALSLAATVLRLSGEVDDAYTSIIAQAAFGLVNYEANRPDQALDALLRVRSLRAQGTFPIIDEPPGLNILAEIYLDRGQVSAAQEAIERAITIQRQTGGETIDRLGESRRIYAEVLIAQGDQDRALRIARQNVSLGGERLLELSRDPSYGSEFAPLLLRKQVGQLMDLLWEISGGQPGSDNIAEMFQAAQLLHLNETSRATNGFVANLAPDDPTVQRLFLQRRSTTEELRALERSMGQSASSDGPAPGTSVSVLERIEDLRRARQQLDQEIETLAPDLFGILSPQPVSVAELQSRLQQREAMVLQATFDQATYVFLLTKTELKLARTIYDAQSLEDDVRDLRLTIDVTTPDGLLPFDFAAAERIFDGIFKPFQDELATLDTLVVTPDLSAQQISLAMLVRRDPELPIEFGAGHPEFRFLGLTHALNIVPSPTAFLRLRSSDTLKLTRDGFLGFGDPVLRGDGTSDTRGFTRAINRSTRLANPGVIADMFEPLPETARELEWMADKQDPAKQRIVLGPDATESNVKNTDYSEVNIVAFATHAVVSGDFDHLTEPALIMTPPDAATPENDGLLTASEIALLSIDADIVVLSACNTGSASGRRGAPGLSGLAGGFFRAGARSVVVSHWTILSVSSLVLMPDFLSLATQDDPLPPAEAMRRSMLKVSNDTRAEAFAHPAVWAPFAIVGT